jgi:hypothetical protein
MTMVAKTACVVPVARLPMTGMAAEASAIPVIMAGPVMVVTVVMPKTVKAAAEVMSKKIMSKRVVASKSVAKTVTGESPRHGVGLSHRNGKENRGSNGNGFSQRHISHRQQRRIRKEHYPPSQRQIRPATVYKRSG